MNPISLPSCVLAIAAITYAPCAFAVAEPDLVFLNPCSGTCSVQGGGDGGNPGHCILGNTTQNSAAMLGVTPGPTDIVFANGVERFELPSSGPSP